MTVRVLRPPELERLGARHAVVEASAGTGKTYILEHLVVDLLLRREVELEQILVVTFTEKATAELVQRVRLKLAELRDVGPEHSLARAAAAAPDEACWLIDERARTRLRNALLGFDRASITTIHGFCQRLLGEHAFLQQRLFDEELVDEGTAFHTAFLDVVRRDAADPVLAPYLEAWLRGNRLERLEGTLLAAHRHLVRGSVTVRPAPLDVAALAAAAQACTPVAAGDPVLLEQLKKARVHGNSVRKVLECLALVSELAGHFQRTRDAAALLAGLDEVDRLKGGGTLAYLATHLTTAAALPALTSLGRAYLALLAAAVPLAAELVHRILPRVSARLEARKREAGLYDFQDMLGLVARGLDDDGPRQRALLATLRARYRFALIDEFQDTDDLQWRIFRRIFVEGGGPHVLTVIGDPKQAIYGFRGADVHTYLDACGALATDKVHLTKNFRSTDPLIHAYNAILDQQASSPFFRAGDRIQYDHPVSCGHPETQLLDARGNEAAPVVVLDVRTTEANLLTWQVKQALLGRMVEELRGLLSDTGALRMRTDRDRAVGPSDVFVLTRTTRESREVGEALRAAGIPFAFFKQEYLFKTIEAAEVLDLLRAIADPDDRTARARAWITAFFGLSLPDLAACEDLPPGHALARLLYDWKGLADDGQLETMLARIVRDSGIVCREVFLRESERSLTNYLHVLEVLQEEVGRSRCTVRELAQTLGAYVSGARKPPGLQSDLQRLETDRHAVQIMTIHHAKGLEADVVFLYGGFWEGPRDLVRSLHEPAGKVMRVGRAPATEDQRIADEREDEERRVLYVALTRARGRLYLPRYPAAFKALRGCYRIINERLSDLLNGFTPPETVALFAQAPIPCPAPAPAMLSAAPALAGWQPPPALLAPDPSDSELHELAARRAGFALTSYSAVKRRHGGFTPAADDPAANEPGADTTVDGALPPGELPRGRLSGSFLHEALEELALEPLQARPPFDEWRARPDVVALFEKLRRRHDRQLAHLPHAQRLVYTALTAPVRLGETLMSGLCDAPHVLREMEFLYPIPETHQPLLGTTADGGRAWRIERGAVKGFIDLLFEHEGRVYVCDWKGDWLPHFTAAALAEHTARNYATQARLYTLAALRLCGLDGVAAYEARFGGVVYCFLRGRRADDPTAGVSFERPSWDEVRGWEREMLSDRFWGLG